MKHFNFLTTAALAFTLFAAAASSLAIHQSASAAGAYRMEFRANVIPGTGALTVAIGAIVDAADSATAISDAEDECEFVRDALNPNFAGNTADPNCDESPEDATVTNPNDDSPRSPVFPDGEFADECIVVVGRVGDSLLSNIGIGVGIEADCVMARTAAIANCAPANCGTTRVVLPLNRNGDLYLTDGNAGICPNGQFDSNNPSDPSDLNCIAATNSGYCAINTPGLPILEGTTCREIQTNGECRGIDSNNPVLIDGNCEATCPNGADANPDNEAGCAALAMNSQECLDADVNTPIFKGGSCEPAADDGECSSEHPTLPVLAQDGPGACRAQTQAECNLIPTTPILDDGACRSPTIAECF